MTVALDVDDRVRLEVRDDGVGFDPGMPSRAQALGLVSMAERALSLSGRLTIDSAPGRGTIVRFECPALPPGAAADRA